MPEGEGCHRAGVDNCGKCESISGLMLVKAVTPENYRFPVLKHSIASADTVA